MLTRLLGLLAMCAALAVVLVATGCGGGDDVATQAELQEVVVSGRDRVDFALARIPKAKSLDEYVNRMDEAAVVIDDAASRLEEITPPPEFEPEATKLEKALRQLAVDYDGAADQIRLTPEILGGAAGLSFDSWDRANLALAGLAGKGLEVSVLQPHA